MAIPACDALVTLLPGNHNTLIQAGEAYASLARMKRQHGQDPSDVLDRAEYLGTIALNREQNNFKTIKLLGSVKFRKAVWMQARGGDAQELLGEAVDYLQRALSYAPGDSTVLSELADALRAKGQMEYANGRDGDPEYEKSNRIQRQLIELPNASVATWSAYANGLAWQGYYRYSSGNDDAQVSTEHGTWILPTELCSTLLIIRMY